MRCRFRNRCRLIGRIGRGRQRIGIEPEVVDVKISAAADSKNFKIDAGYVVIDGLRELHPWSRVEISCIGTELTRGPDNESRSHRARHNINIESQLSAL